MVPITRFTELLDDIEPSKTTKSNASSGHQGIREHLEFHDTYKRFVRAFLSGSYARDTAIRPTATADGKERPDVDIIVVTNHIQSDNPDTVLRALARALESGDDPYAVERINKRSVRVVTWAAEMDVVPVIAANGSFLIADRETGQWKLTNPPAHTDWSSQQNTAFNGRFKRLVKLFKWWRRVNPSGRRPKGFVLEVLVAQHAPKDETHWGEAFAKLLENIYATYRFSAALGLKPTIHDPGMPGNDILSKVTAAQWKDFIEKVRVYAEIARRAQSADDIEEATRLWRRVFGERFRSTSTPVRAVSASSFATAPVAPVGYSFPNQPAAPNRPRGFA
jgi:hypothetical protein